MYSTWYKRLLFIYNYTKTTKFYTLSLHDALPIFRDQVKSSRFRLEVSTADMRDEDRATDGPEDAVVQHLTNQQLLECVQQLGSEQQECIVLRFLHGLSVSETAEIMGKKDGAIKALQHRAVRRLAGLLPEGLR